MFFSVAILLWAATFFYAMAESGYQLTQHNKLSTLGALTGKHPIPAQGVSGLGDVGAPQGGIAAAIVGYAQGQLGKPYLWGGPSRDDCANPDGFDCSGLIRCCVWTATNGKWSLAHHAATQQAELSRWPARGGPQPGDIWYYLVPTDIAKPGHAGVYIGGGKVIHAPHHGVPVQVGNADMYPVTGRFRPADRYTGGNPPGGGHAGVGNEAAALR